MKHKHLTDEGYDAKILITRKCNLRCSFCKIRRSERLKNELSLEEWKKGIKNLEKIGVKSIQILGGEPTTLDYLEDLIKFLNKETQIFYSIESNSTFDNKRFNSLLKAGIKGYCGDVNTFNFSKKQDWYTVKANKGFNMLLRMKKVEVPYVEASIILNKRNIKETPFIVEKLSKLGIWSNIIPVHYGNIYKWEFRADGIANEFKINESDRPIVEKTMSKLIRMKEQGFKIINPKEYFNNLAKINCNPIGWHCTTLPRLRIDADGSLWVCNDVKGETSKKYDILNLNKEIYKKFKIDWIYDKQRIKCPGCAWSIAWPTIHKR